MGTQDRNGAEYGACNFENPTDAFTIVSAVVDTNGTCGVWIGGPWFAGVLTSSGGGKDRVYLLSLSAGGVVELRPVESRKVELWGSFADAYRKNVCVFTRTGDESLVYFNTQTQASGTIGYAAGVEYGCATLLGDDEGALVPNLTPTCLVPAPVRSGPVDTNGAAGLSGVTGLWGFDVDDDQVVTPTFRGFRVERD